MDEVSPAEAQLAVLLGVKVKEGLDVCGLLQERSREDTHMAFLTWTPLGLHKQLHCLHRGTDVC